MTGRKLENWQKSLNFWGGKVWNELLSKYMIYAPNERQINALKLILEINGKFDRYKIGKMAKKQKKNGNSKIQKIRPTDNVIRKQYTKFHESRTFGCWDVMYLSFYEQFLGNTQKMKNSKFQKIRPIQTATKNLYPNFYWHRSNGHWDMTYRIVITRTRTRKNATYRVLRRSH